MSATYDVFLQAKALRGAIAERLKALAGKPEAKDAVAALQALDESVAAVQQGSNAALGVGPINRELTRLLQMISTADARPAPALQAGVDGLCHQTSARLASWREVNSQKIQAANGMLQKFGQAALPVAAGIPADPSCASAAPNAQP